MSAEHKLLDHVPSGDKERISRTLDRVIPYFKEDEYAIVGGLAISYHLAQHNISHPFNTSELDLIAKTPESVSPKITEDFMIYHYHYREPFFYLCMDDKTEKMHLDVFTYEPEEAVMSVASDGKNYTLVTPETALVKKVGDLQRMFKGDKVSPKEFLDAERLWDIADLDKANDIWNRWSAFWNIWSDYKFDYSLEEGLRRAKKAKEDKVELIVSEPFGGFFQKARKALFCDECKHERNGDFKLTWAPVIYLSRFLKG